MSKYTPAKNGAIDLVHIRTNPVGAPIADIYTSKREVFEGVQWNDREELCRFFAGINSYTIWKDERSPDVALSVANSLAGVEQ